jgi:cell wall-associated NlpC family hydrolase
MKELNFVEIGATVARWALRKLGEMLVTPPGGVGIVSEIAATGYSVAEEETTKRKEIIDFARQQLGEPYVFGAEGPADADLDRWDCSELIEHAYRHAGLVMPDGSKYQRDHCQKVITPQPADVGYFGPNAQGVGHVVMYAGNEEVIEARGKRINGVQHGVVKLTPLFEIETHPRFEGWYRHPDFSRPVEDRA